MSNYLPFARKYRPSRFSDLVGQDALVKTMSHAILSNKIFQSYILSGIRGVGKTTSARIIAKTVNCTSSSIVDGLVAPCEQCTNCISFNKGNHPDIMEIDAASSTGVDDVRAVLESAEYKPLLGKFKIFIIDEVHMFSKSAFNAMLKTLEEPPQMVVFILATTELNKIPLTIISRCQRFDLRRLTLSEIASLLYFVASAESVECDEDAINLIALKSDGSARDALSMLNQATSLSRETKITLSLIQEMIGVGNLNLVVEFVISIFTQNVETATQILQKTYISTSNLIVFTESAIDVIGYAIKTKSIVSYNSTLFGNYHDSIMQSIKDVDIAKLTVIWQIFVNTMQELKNSHNQLLTLEVGAIKAIYAAGLPSPKDVVTKLLDSNSQRDRPRQS